MAKLLPLGMLKLQRHWQNFQFRYNPDVMTRALDLSTAIRLNEGLI
jgi:hypothetical protein